MSYKVIKMKQSRIHYAQYSVQKMKQKKEENRALFTTLATAFNRPKQPIFSNINT